MTARVYSVDPIPGFIPITLSGHRSTIIAAHFSSEGDTIYTCSKDAALFSWAWTARPALPASAAAAIEDAADDDSDSDGAATRPRRRDVALVKATAASAVAKRTRNVEVPDPTSSAAGDYSVLVGEWRLISRHFFKQDHAKASRALCSALPV